MHQNKPKSKIKPLTPRSTKTSRLDKQQRMKFTTSSSSSLLQRKKRLNSSRQSSRPRSQSQHSSPIPTTTHHNTLTSPQNSSLNLILSSHSFSSSSRNNTYQNQSQSNKNNQNDKNNNNSNSSSQNSLKLSKPQIDHIKNLHQPLGRRQSGSFLLEGRKLIESFSIHQNGFVEPRIVYLTYEQHQKIGQLLEEDEKNSKKFKNINNFKSLENTGSQNNDETSLTPLSINHNENSHVDTPSMTETPPVSLTQTPSSLTQTLNNFKNTSFLNNSTQLNWIQKPDGSLTPPLSHSLDQKSLILTKQQHKLYTHMYNKGFVIESSLVSRLSQFSTAPGILAEFNFLSNIIQFNDFEASDMNIGTLSKPKFISDNDLVFGKRSYHQYNQQQQQQQNQHQNGEQNFTKNTHFNINNDWDWKLGGLILGGISDPGNLGTIIRTAHGFGIGQVVVIDGCDIYNQKALSASSGALAHVKVMSCTGTQFVQFIKEVQEIDEGKWNDEIKNNQEDNENTENTEKNIENGKKQAIFKNILSNIHLEQPYLVGLTPNRGLNLHSIPKTLHQHIGKIIGITDFDDQQNHHQQDKPLTLRQTNISHNINQNTPWLVVGSEAFGLPAQIECLLHTVATIPVKDDFVDSLNASVAASIGLYVMKQ